jgi:hypothetical protein
LKTKIVFKKYRNIILKNTNGAGASPARLLLEWKISYFGDVVAQWLRPLGGTRL